MFALVCISTNYVAIGLNILFGKSFKLDNPKDLDKLIHSAIEEIWIDTEKGLDVADVTAPRPPTPDPEPLDVVPSIIKRTVSFDEELSAAKNTHKNEKCRHVDVQ